MKLNRGDIVIANLESVSKGSIQKYTRPYIIISNNKANQYSPVVTAVAMSTKTWKKKYLPTHCLIPAAKVKVTDTDFEVFDSMALCEQIVSIDVNVQIERVVASISDTELLDKITVQLNITGAFAPGYIATCILWVAFLLKGGIDFMTAEEYRALLDVDFNNVKIEDLTDIRKIKIDKNQPQSKRQAQFLKQVGNPYMLRRGSMMIKVSFANNGLSMEQAFENLLLNV